MRPEKNRKKAAQPPVAIDPERKLLRAAEVGRILGIPRSSAYALMSSGKIPVVRMGALVRVPATAIDEWIASRTAQPNRS